MSKYQLLRLKNDMLRRNLLLKVYTIDKIDAKRQPHDHQYADHNINHNNFFIINNYRQALNFTFYTWRIFEEIEKGKINIGNLEEDMLQELMVTLTPSHKTLLHYLTNFDTLNVLFRSLNDEASGGVVNKGEEAFDPDAVLFQPDVEGNTPLHNAIRTNNT